VSRPWEIRTWRSAFDLPVASKSIAMRSSVVVPGATVGASSDVAFAALRALPVDLRRTLFPVAHETQLIIDWAAATALDHIGAPDARLRREDAQGFLNRQQPHDSFLGLDDALVPGIR
jgi:hypothetical protein